jgi:hypothetical protein
MWAMNQGGAAMAGHAQTAKAFNVRLPVWASDFLDRRSAETGVTKTQVMVDAISCLRAESVQALMREGYEEMREIDHQMAEEGMSAGSESLPEW